TRFRLVDLCGQCSRRTHISTRTCGAPPVDCGFAGRGRSGVNGGLNSANGINGQGLQAAALPCLTPRQRKRLDPFPNSPRAQVPPENEAALSTLPPEVFRSPVACGNRSSGERLFLRRHQGNAGLQTEVIDVQVSLSQTASSIHPEPDRGRESWRFCRRRTAPVLPRQDTRCEPPPPWWPANRSRSNHRRERLEAMPSLAWAG